MDYFRSSVGKLHSLRALSRDDCCLLGKAWILLLVMELGLRTTSLQRAQSFGGRANRTFENSSSPSAAITAARLGQLVDVAGRHHLFTIRCLCRALVLRLLLAQRGIAADLQIGVRRECDTICAHAWLEADGQPIGEPPTTGLDGFARLVRVGVSR